MRLYARYALPLLVLSSFGPVVGGGVRLEHVAAFGLALLGLVFTNGRRLPASIALAGLAWLALVGVAIADTLHAASVHTLPLQHPMGAPKDVDPISFRNILTGLAQLLLPVAASVVALRADDGAGRVFALRALVVLTAANTLLAALQLVAPEAILPVLKLFWPGGDEGTPLLSMGNGRFGGIFNHPAEAAMATTLALFVLPEAWKDGGRDWAVGLLLPLLVLGGLLSFSKTVLFLGFPLAFLYLGMEHRRAVVFSRRALLLLGAWSGAAVLGIVTVLTRAGITMETFASLVSITTVGDGGVVGTATGGRFSAGDTGSVAWAFAQVFDRSPLLGLGFGTFLAYDSMYLVAFAYAGLVGLVAYGGLLAALAARVKRAARPRTLGFTLLFVALAGLGIPTFTSVRVGVLLTVFVCLLLTPPKEALRVA